MRRVGGSLVLVLVTFSYCDVTVSEDKEPEGTCSADAKDCAGKFGSLWMCDV